jgi:6-phosphogluconolactonase
MINNKNTIQIFETPEALCKGMADFILNLAQQSVQSRGKFVVALSGGNTPKALYELLAKSPYREQMPWTQTFFFWGDERCVPETDKQNNSFMTRQALLNKIEIPENNIYPVQTGLAPHLAAMAYEQTIRDFFEQSFPVFDLMLLGLGENGHTASLFPGTAAIHEEMHLVTEVFVEELKMFRITLTIPVINNSANIVFLVSGQSKAEVVQKVINTGYNENHLPAQLIRAVKGRLYWFLDRQAASKLSAEGQ